jgi:hypothetical protein
MTPAQGLLTIRQQLNETTAAFWSDAEIYGYMWEAECLLAGKLGLNQAVTAHTTITDASAYTCPDSWNRISRLTYDGKKLKRGDFTDRDYLDGTNYGSTPQSGKPQMYTEWGNNVYLFPVPDTAVGLNFFGLKSPPQIVTASTLFSIREEAIQQMIPDYAIWKASLKDGDAGRADRHKQAWEINILRAESMWVDKKGEDRIYAVKDEDEYPGGSLGMD